MRTCGGGARGWGNVVRLRHLADRLRSTLPQTAFQFVAEGPEPVNTYLTDAGYDCMRLPDGLSVAAESAIWQRMGQVTAVIAELEDATTSRQELWRSVSSRLIVLDDLLLHRSCANLLICAQPPPADAAKLMPADTRFLHGYGYYVAAPDFAKPISNVCDGEGNRLLVSLGGSPELHGFQKIVEMLAPRAGDWRIAVAAGLDANQASLVERRWPHIEIIGPCSKMAALYAQADVGLIGGGYSKIEAAIMRLPMATVAMVLHQVPLCERFADATGTPFLGLAHELTAQVLFENLERLFHGPARGRLLDSYSRSIDGLGASRVAAAIVQYLGETGVSGGGV